MIRMRKLLVIILASLVLTACSTGGKEESQLAKIEADNKLVVGIEGAYPPFNYFDSNNQLIGFDVDIADEIAKRMDLEVEYKPTPWDTIIGGLQAKKFDVIISSVAPTEERKAKVDFTDSYYTTGVQIFTEDKSEIKTHADIEGKKIGVATGTTFAEEAERLGGEAVFYDNDLLTFQDLTNGRVDAVITDRAVGSRIIKEHGYPFVAIGDLLYEEKPGITLAKDEPELKEKLNEILKEMKADGTYEKISQEWFGENIE